ncbi:MAG TPA: ribonuclease HII [Candidatus Binatia bacterium]|nr:ribonuclease HII [Candidatus Binatia bacterium]
MMRVEPDTRFESEFWKSGLLHVAGLDEAGRGALAGPVAVGAVILPDDPSRLARTLAGVRDSKQMTPLERESLAPRIWETALAWGVAFASAEEIDSLGIVPATRLAALRALQELPVCPQYLLTDFRLELPQLDISQTALVKGDMYCLSIAAASVLAKTTRDAYMRALDIQYHGYGLEKHKGYGTQAHRLALKRLGISPIHRRSFQVKDLLSTPCSCAKRIS